MSIPRAQRNSLVPDTQASPQPGVSLTFGVTNTNGLGSPYSGRRPTPPACAPKSSLRVLSNGRSGPIARLLPQNLPLTSWTAKCENSQWPGCQLPHLSISLTSEKFPTFPLKESGGMWFEHCSFPSSAHSRLSERKLTSLPSGASGPSSDPPASLHRHAVANACFFMYVFFTIKQFFLCVEYNIVAECSNWI